MKRTLIILAFLCAGGALLYLAQSGSDRGDGGRSRERTASTADLMQQYLALERAENEHDQTTWAPELQSLVHEMVFVRLWDALRGASDEYEPLRNFAFGNITLATNVVRSEDLQHGIRRHEYAGGGWKLDAGSFKALLQSWKDAGWRMEQWEFRHPFFAATNDIPRSIFNFVVHARHPQQDRRLILRGQLGVQWRTNQPGQEPFPDSISVDQFEFLERIGSPLFVPLFSETLPPVPDLHTLDPYLLVYDLNGDSLPEVGLATHNAVLSFANGSFTPARLCEKPRRYTHAALFGDFNSDGHVDYLACDLEGIWLYDGDPTGRFPREPKLAWLPPQPLFNPFVLTSGDIDADGDLDVWLAQYKLPYIEGQMPTPYYDANDGFPSFLLVNGGRGNFTDRTEAAGLASKRFRRTYSNSFVDLDHDLDLDLLVVSDFAGIDLHLNDGRGNFRDATSELISNPHAFGMAHSLADFNRDAALDILMIGMDSAVAERLDGLGLGRSAFPGHQQKRPAMAHGNRLYLRSGEKYVETELSDQLAKGGWAWGVTSLDFDNDSDLDIYIVNGHNSRASAADYESHFWRHDIYAATAESNPLTDMYFRSMASKLYGAGLSYGGFHLNRFYLNAGARGYVEVAYLLGLSVQEDCRNLVSADLDGDGRLDLLFTTFQQWPERRQGLHIFRNNSPAGNWARLVPLNPSLRPAVRLGGAGEATFTTQLVTGDSYRSQHPPVFHLGLGQARSLHGEFRASGSALPQPFTATHGETTLLK